MRIVFLLALVFSCGCSCGDNDKGSYFLDKDYDFVLGFAVPDEDRLAPTEVFVGRIIDKEPDEITVQEGFLDTFLLHQVQRYQGWYHFVVKYHEDAEVYISSATQKIKLEHTGFGVYRDVGNELHIEANKSYELEVIRPHGRYYSQWVLVPGPVQINNITNGDTIGPIFPKETTAEGFCYKLQFITWNSVNSAQLFRIKASHDAHFLHDPFVFYAGFKNDDQAIVAFYKSNDSLDTLRDARWETLAFDSTASRFYQAESPMGLNPAVNEFFTYWNQGPIVRRNGLNTHGARDVIGNFGAYTAARIHFWIWAKKDSCGMAP